MGRMVLNKGIFAFQSFTDEALEPLQIMLCSSRSKKYILMATFRSDQISCSVVSDSFRPHELQHARPPCPSPTPGVHSNSCPLSRWCHPAISASVVPFSSCPQSLPASESFPMSQLFTWGSQSIAVSALASFLPKKSRFPIYSVVSVGAMGGK